MKESCTRPEELEAFTQLADKVSVYIQENGLISDHCLAFLQMIKTAVDAVKTDTVNDDIFLGILSHEAVKLAYCIIGGTLRYVDKTLAEQANTTPKMSGTVSIDLATTMVLGIVLENAVRTRKIRLDQTVKELLIEFCHNDPVGVEIIEALGKNKG